MSAELIISIAAVVIAWLIFTWLIQVVKASVSTAIAIAAIALILQLVFGIGYQDVWQQIVSTSQTVWQFFANQ